MALEGSIRDFSLADIFQLIGIQRKTGVLTLQNQDEEVKVFFLNGMVVNADSKTKRLDDRLGSVLTKTGKLSAENLKKALKIQRDTLKKIGHVLVEEAFVRPEDLREALSIQITQIIYRLFRWKDGDYHFEQDVNVDYDKENFTPMSAESILMEGMRMIDEWPIIEHKITSFEMVFERVALGGGTELEPDAGEEREEDLGPFGEAKVARKEGKSEAATSRIKLTREEKIAYEQVNGKATVQEVIERTMLSEFETCRALFDLMNRNLIAPVAAPKKLAAGSVRSSRDLSGHVATALYLVLAVALVVAIAYQRSNPMNLLTPSPKSPQVQALFREVAAARLERLVEAIDAYVLVNQQTPGSSDQLVEQGLLRPADLLDPWGRPLTLEIRDGQAVASCCDPELRRERHLSP